MGVAMDDVEYRKKASGLFENITRHFDDIDPDVAEAEYAQGTLSILAGGKKIILSLQPPVQQIWLAVAAQGVAVHFSWNAEKQQWLDDKDRGLELLFFLEQVLGRQNVQVSLQKLSKK